jgi:hypothetical protein
MKHLRFLALLSALFLTGAGQASDLSITAANVKIGTDTTVVRYKDAIAGATITAGQVVYSDDSDSGRIKLADANGTAAQANVLGIAAHGASADQPIRVIISDPSFRPGATLSLTEQIYILSATPGGIAPASDATTGWVKVVLFVANTTSVANFRPLHGTAAVP